MVKTILKLSLLCLLIFTVQSVSAQGYDQENIKLAKFVERMYKNSPFEGCRIIDDYDNSFFLSVVALNKKMYKTQQIMNRVAQVKSQRNAGEFFNGSQSYTSITVRTPKGEAHDSDMTEVYELINTNSIGYVRQMQLLTSFDDSANMRVFVYYKKVNADNEK